MNVLSLFGGIECARVAFDRAGIAVESYYSSEVDKYAMVVTQARYPDIVQLGDIRNWRDWDLPPIDLVIGGSPCQDLSVAGRRNGMRVDNIDITTLAQYRQLKRDGYTFVGQSYLFWEYVEVLRHVKPRYFVLENVAKMDKRWQAAMSDALGLTPVMIDSALVSAQRRQRLYWTNICVVHDALGRAHTGIPQPSDRGIVLADILEPDAREPMLSNTYGGFGEETPRVHYGKSVTIRANSGGGSIPSVAVKYNRKQGVIGEIRKAQPLQSSDWRGLNRNQSQTAVIRKKSRTVRGGGRNSYDNHEWDSVDDLHIRKLTVLECERLQTLPDGYTAVGISNTQRYRCIGNGMTVDVIAHILSYIGSEQCRR